MQLLNKKPIIMGIMVLSAILAVGLYMQNTNAFADSSGAPIKNQGHDFSESKILHTTDGKKVPKQHCGEDDADCGSDD